jgi:membrane protein
MFSIIYYLIPYERLGIGVVIVSAFWATLLWEIAKQAFGYYVTNVATIGRIYGAYVMIVVVAFWIYYSSIVFVLGAEIGQLYRERFLPDVEHDLDVGDL